jgi:hypothetical protein
LHEKDYLCPYERVDFAPFQDKLMAKKETINVKGADIAVIAIENADYISLTDMAHSQMEEHIIFKWLSLKSTIEYIGEWEALYNPDFNYTEFGTIKNAAGSNNFVLSVKQWIERTGAKGITAKTGRYGGTYAHKDIAFHFGMWISPQFQLLLVKEFQRLKDDENQRLSLEWNLQRTLSKINYRIHTDAIKEHIIPAAVTKEQMMYTYASEADLLNVALFGKTAGQWRSENPDVRGISATAQRWSIWWYCPIWRASTLCSFVKACRKVNGSNNSTPRPSLRCARLPKDAISQKGSSNRL